MAETAAQPEVRGLMTEFDPRSARKNGRVFDPSQHFRKLGGRGEYLDVKFRLIWLRSEYPEAVIETKCLHFQFNDAKKNNNFALFWARVSLPEGMGSAEAHGSESQNDFGDFYEKAETKAVGRALEYLGYGTTSAADDREALADSPYEERRDAGRDRDRGRERDRGRDDDRGRERDRDRDEERPARRSRDDDSFDDRRREEPPPRKEEPAPKRKAVEVPPLDDDEVDDDTNRAFGFPAAEHDGVVYTNLLKVQKAMDTMPGRDAVARHEGRQGLYRAILKAKWTSAAIGEVKGYWTAANKRDEAEDAAGAIEDDEDDEV